MIEKSEKKQKMKKMKKDISMTNKRKIQVQKQNGKTDENAKKNVQKKQITKQKKTQINVNEQMLKNVENCQKNKCNHFVSFLFFVNANTKTRDTFAFQPFLSVWDPLLPKKCDCQQNNSTQNDETSSQRHRSWDPTSLCAERVREPKPKQPMQKPTQAILTAEGFVVLVNVQTCFARFENGTCSVRQEKEQENKLIGKSRK